MEASAPLGDAAGEPVHQRFLTGKVTAVTSDGGMVNDYIYFETGVVLGGVKLEVGDVVRVDAERKHSKGGWMARRCAVGGAPWKGVGL